MGMRCPKHLLWQRQWSQMPLLGSNIVFKRHERMAQNLPSGSVLSSASDSNSDICCAIEVLRLRSGENQVMLSVEAPDFSPAARGQEQPGFSPGQHELHNWG